MEGVHLYESESCSKEDGLYIAYVQRGDRNSDGTTYNDSYAQNIREGKNDPCTSCFRQSRGTQEIYGRFDGSGRNGNICPKHCDSLLSRNLFVIEYMDDGEVYYFACYDPRKKIKMDLENKDFVMYMVSGSCAFFAGIVVSKNPIEERTEEEWRDFFKKNAQ